MVITDDEIFKRKVRAAETRSSLSRSITTIIDLSLLMRCIRERVSDLEEGRRLETTIDIADRVPVSTHKLRTRKPMGRSKTS